MRRFMSVLAALCFIFSSIQMAAAASQSAAKKPSLAEPAAARNSSSEEASPMLRVGLLQGEDAVMISSTESFVLRDASNGQGIWKSKPGEKLTIRRSGKSFLLDKKGISASELRVLIPNAKQEAALQLAGKSYRGELLLRIEAAGIQVINKLPLDAYLYGVVGGEMSEAWPAEALKAQAVAARTFALYSRDKHKGAGFDVCATTHCQVYGGIAAEGSSVRAAVDATRGEVLCYQGKPIYAAFHTSSGGMTENSEDVWGSYLPYLRAVPDEDSASPSHHWQVKLTTQLFQNKLAAAGYKLGSLQRISLTPLKPGGGKTEDRTASGRVSLVTFTGSAGSASLTGNDMRRVFGLKSTLFDLTLESPENRKVIGAMGSAKKDVAANLPDVKEKHYLAKKVHILTNQPGENILIDGYGWGHGLGLAQWGARAMAAKADYKTILSHYYTKAELKKFY